MEVATTTAMTQMEITPVPAMMAIGLTVMDTHVKVGKMHPRVLLHFAKCNLLIIGAQNMIRKLILWTHNMLKIVINHTPRCSQNLEFRGDPCCLR